MAIKILYQCDVCKDIHAYYLSGKPPVCNRCGDELRMVTGLEG